MSSDLKPYSSLASERVPLEQKIPLEAPLVMFIELTNRCNFSCRFCPESFSDYAEQVGGIHHLSIENFVKVCRDVQALGRLKALRFHMLGDALLHKDAPEMIRIASEMGLADRIELTTNGTALVGSRLDAILESGLDYLRVSVYAMTPDRHREITGSRVAPSQVAANVRAFRDRRNELGKTRPYIYAKMIDEKNEEEASAFETVWGEIADECCLEPSQNWNGFDERDLEEKVFSGAPVDNRPVREKREVCPFPFYTLVVHSDGEVSVCCVDWNKKTSVGNVFKSSLASIWRGQRMKDFRKMHIERRRCENESCRNCDYPAMSRDNLDGLVDPAILD